MNDAQHLISSNTQYAIHNTRNDPPSALESLLAVYRQGLVALYPSGATYGTAQHADGERFLREFARAAASSSSSTTTSSSRGGAAAFPNASAAVVLAVGSLGGGSSDMTQEAIAAAATSLGWVEREVRLCRSVYEAEAHALDAEVSAIAYICVCMCGYFFFLFVLTFL